MYIATRNRQVGNGPANFASAGRRNAGRAGSRGGPAAASRSFDAGKATRHGPGANIPSYSEIDNFTADFVGNRDVADAMRDLSTHYHEQGMAVTSELTDKVNALADAMGISHEAGMRNHARLTDAFIQSKQAPPMAPELAKAKNRDEYAQRKAPPPQTDEGFWASSAQLGAGYLAGKILGTNPVWGSLFSTTMGLTGPGNTSLHLSDETFGKSAGGGFFAGVKNALASIGNFFSDGLGDHSKIHDVLGQVYTKLGIGPGYAYAPGALDPPGNSFTGQISGTLYSFGRKVSALAADAWSAVKTGVRALFSDSGRTQQASILERRDYAMFARPGQSFADYQEDAAARSVAITDAIRAGASGAWDALTETAGDVAGNISDAISSGWDSVKDAFGFGDKPEREEKQERGDEPSVRSERSDPQTESNDVRDSGSF